MQSLTQDKNSRDKKIANESRWRNWQIFSPGENFHVHGKTIAIQTEIFTRKLSPISPPALYGKIYHNIFVEDCIVDVATLQYNTKIAGLGKNFRLNDICYYATAHWRTTVVSVETLSSDECKVSTTNQYIMHTIYMYYMYVSCTFGLIFPT